MEKITKTNIVRLIGAVLAFFGVMLVYYKQVLTGTLLSVVAIAMLIAGFYMVVTGIRAMASKSKSTKTNKSVLYLLVGLLLLAAGILGLVYQSQISRWFLLIVGIAVAAFGLVILVMLTLANRGKKLVVLDIICATLTILVGVGIALLYIGSVSSAANGVCYYVFGGMAIAVGAVELIMY